MAHPCASKNPPAFCNKKKRKPSRYSCSCPSGWERSGIMCSKGAQRMRATCKPKGKRKGTRKGKGKRK